MTATTLHRRRGRANDAHGIWTCQASGRCPFSHMIATKWRRDEEPLSRASVCVGRVLSRWRGTYCLAPASLQRFGHSISAPQLTSPGLFVPGPGATHLPAAFLTSHPRFQGVGGAGVRLSRSRVPLRPIGAPPRGERSPAGWVDLGKLDAAGTEDFVGSSGEQGVALGPPWGPTDGKGEEEREVALARTGVFTLQLLRRIPRPRLPFSP